MQCSEGNPFLGIRQHHISRLTSSIRMPCTLNVSEKCIMMNILLRGVSLVSMNEFDHARMMHV